MQFRPERVKVFRNFESVCMRRTALPLAQPSGRSRGQLCPVHRLRQISVHPYNAATHTPTRACSKTLRNAPRFSRSFRPGPVTSYLMARFRLCESAFGVMRNFFGVKAAVFAPIDQLTVPDFSLRIVLHVRPSFLKGRKPIPGAWE